MVKVPVVMMLDTTEPESEPKSDDGHLGRAAARAAEQLQGKRHEELPSAEQGENDAEDDVADQQVGDDAEGDADD